MTEPDDVELWSRIRDDDADAFDPDRLPSAPSEPMLPPPRPAAAPPAPTVLTLKES